VRHYIYIYIYISKSKTAEQASAAEALYAIVNEYCGIRLVDVTQVYDQRSPALET
jgi:hypothetical protein